MSLSSDAAGAQIKNDAGIYFDANPPVYTNKTVNTIEGVITAMQDIEPVLNIACFPNPFTITTSIVFNTDGKHYLEIDDITGRKLKTIECIGKQYELNRNGLAAGVYIIRSQAPGTDYIAITKIIIE